MLAPTLGCGRSRDEMDGRKLATVLAGPADLRAAGSQVDLDRVVAPLGVERIDLALQVLQVIEALVDAGEPDVGDLVELAELVLGERPDPGRVHLGRAFGAQLGLDLVGGTLGGIIRARATGQRLAEAGGELLAVELLAGPVALDDHEAGRLDPLVGREPGGAGGALAAPADRGRIVEIPGVDDPGLPSPAMWTAHRRSCNLAPPPLVVSPDDTTR